MKPELFSYVECPEYQIPDDPENSIEEIAKLRVRYQLSESTSRRNPATADEITLTMEDCRDEIENPTYMHHIAVLVKNAAQEYIGYGILTIPKAGKKNDDDPTEYDGKIGILDEAYIDAPYRDKHIYTHLVNIRMEIAKRLGCHAIVAFPAIDRVSEVRLLGFGFQDVSSNPQVITVLRKELQ